MVQFETIINDLYGAKATTTPGLPSGTAEGDFLLAKIFVLSNVDPEAPTVPEGFFLAPGTWPITLTASGAVADCYIYGKFAEEDEPAPSWGQAGSRNTQGVISRYSGVNKTNPFDVTPSQNSGTGTTTTFNGITTVTDDALLVAVDWDFGDNADDKTPPAGLTDRLDVVLTSVATGLKETHGATGNLTRPNNNNGSSGPFASTLIALRPEAPPEDTAPANTTPAIISGVLEVGETATRTTPGVWTGTPTPSVSGKWQRSDNGSTGWTDISGANASTHVLVSGDLEKYVSYLESATNSEDTVTARSNILGPIEAAPPLDFSIRFSGGASNSNPLASIGGARSSVEYNSNDLFEDLARVDYVSGRVDYRLVYISNDDATAASVTAEILDDSSDVTFSIGVPTQEAGETVTALANSTTVPSGVTFEAGPIDLGDIPDESFRGLYIRRTISAAAAADSNVGWEVTLEVTPL